MVRVGDRLRDQLAETGHDVRASDLDLISGLGIKTLRYPVLWEKIRYGMTDADWSWPDARLKRLRELGIAPVAGLLHHGFGPQPELALQPQFPQAFAQFAEAVARRYPWIDAFTPINEPLTTARISGLYGLWYPHGRDETLCFRLLVAQCSAVAAAMAAIRKINPNARLVQTEDLGHIFSTAPLRYQADYENERRWLGLDLITGRVDRSHTFHERLIAAGVSETDLAQLVAQPCPPDLLGIDYYLTSDRFLDHRLWLYPHEPIGGNGIHVYVDAAAVRSPYRGKATLAARIDEAWKRYRLPLALTEIHNGCTRDEQLRWLLEAWQTARAARGKGIDLRAVTAWALFGMVDWNSMLLRRDRHYENGAFDIRCQPPRPTALSRAIARLTSGETYDHPVLDRPGWWQEESPSRMPARLLLLSGGGKMQKILEDCCRARRLAIACCDPHPSDQKLPDAAWSSIQVSSTPGGRRLICRYADGGLLDLEVDHSADPHCVANACLDVLIDGPRGKARLLCVMPANQYEISFAAESACPQR
jgi:dTDP-4-dehydrorhamnose reductase